MKTEEGGGRKEGSITGVVCPKKFPSPLPLTRYSQTTERRETPFFSSWCVRAFLFSPLLRSIYFACLRSLRVRGEKKGRAHIHARKVEETERSTYATDHTHTCREQRKRGE